MLINYKERDRRIRQAHEEAWWASRDVEADPGLRKSYGSLPRAPIRLLCSKLVKDVNHGGMLRVAEAFRLERVAFSPEDDEAVDMGGTRGSHQWQPFEWTPIQQSVDEALKEGYLTVALTLNSRAIPLEEVPWSFPLAIVMGEEKYGIPHEVEDRCHVSAAIPLFGIVTSLNVTTAAAIAVHAAVAAYRRVHPEYEPARNTSRRLLGFEDRAQD